MNKLEQYVSSLEVLTRKQTLKGHADEYRDVVQLIDEGLVGSSIEPQTNLENEVVIYDAEITPKGALALVEWKNVIWKNSTSGKASSIIDKLLFLAIGAILAKIDEIIVLFL